MRPGELAQYIHEHIPLSKAMAVSVVAVEDDAITLQAPLEPNLNHRQTVFGGSASALAILASWALLHVRLQAAGIADRLVINATPLNTGIPSSGNSRRARCWSAPTPGGSSPSCSRAGVGRGSPWWRCSSTWDALLAGSAASSSLWATASREHPAAALHRELPLWRCSVRAHRRARADRSLLLPDVPQGLRRATGDERAVAAAAHRSTVIVWANRSWCESAWAPSTSH